MGEVKEGQNEDRTIKTRETGRRGKERMGGVGGRIRWGVRVEIR